MNLGMSERRGLRVARASGPLVSAFCRNELSETFECEPMRAPELPSLNASLRVSGSAFRQRRVREVRGGGTPPPTRGTRALPGVRSRAFTA